MLDQVHVLPPTVCYFCVISVHPFVSDHVIARKVPKVHKMSPILIGGHTQDGIMWDVDLCHNGLDFFVIFKSDESHVNNIKNTHRQ